MDRAGRRDTAVPRLLDRHIAITPRWIVREEVLAAAGLLALVVFLFHEAVFSGAVLYQRDLHLYWRSQMEAMLRIVASGSWPLWDPYVSFGRPLLAQPQTQLFYPITWLNWIVRPGPLYTLYTVVHVAGSAVGVFLLTRRLGASRGGALVAGAVWATSGPLLSFVSLWHHLAGAAWIPWVLVAGDRALASPRSGATLLFSLAMTMQVFAGSADMCALTAPCLALILARHVRWRALRDPANLRLLVTCLLAFALALGLSTCQWLPTLATASGSSRFRLPEVIRTFWSLRPVELAQLVLPVFLPGLPLRPEYRAMIADGREPFLSSVYLGLPALGLVVASALSRRKEPLAIAGLGLLGALVSMGRHAPVYPVVVALFPPLRILRYPVKALILVALTWAVLAGIGFDAWWAPGVPRRSWLRGVVAPLALGSGLAWGLAALLQAPVDDWGLRFLMTPAGVRLSETLAPTASWISFSAALSALVAALALLRALLGRPRVGIAALVALLATFELSATHRHLNPTMRAELLEARPAALAHVPRDERQRLYVYEYKLVEGSAEHYLGRPLAFIPGNVPPGWPVDMAMTLGLREYVLPPVGETWGWYSGYEIDPLGLYPQALLDLTSKLHDVEETPMQRRLLRIGAVSHVIALHERGFEDLDRVAQVSTTFPESLKLFRVPDALPRLYAVAGVRAAAPGAEVAALLAPDFDPEREVVLSGTQAHDVLPAPLAARIRSAVLKADRVRVEVEFDRPGYLVLADAYDSGWKARLDASPVPLLRANAAFRAVAVPQGLHVVEQVYRPGSVLAGLVVSGLTAAGISWFFGHRLRPRSRELRTE